MKRFCIAAIAVILACSLSLSAQGQLEPVTWGGSSSGTTLPVADTTAVVKGSADATKQVRIEADGVTAGQTRAIFAPDADTYLPVFTSSFAVSAPIRFPAGTAAAPSIAWASDTDTGFFQPAAGNIDVSVDGVARYRFGSGGLLSATDGIGLGTSVVSWDIAFRRGAVGVGDIKGSGTGSANVRIFGNGSTGTKYLSLQHDGTRASISSTENTVDLNDTANSARWVTGSISELITLSTSGSTTDSSADMLPADSLINGVACRVTTTITTATDWSVGDATTAARFSSANSTLTANTTSVGLNHLKGGTTTDAAGPTQTSAGKLRITTTGTPGAGAVRCTVFYEQWIAPTS